MYVSSKVNISPNYPGNRPSSCLMKENESMSTIITSIAYTVYKKNSTSVRSRN